MTSKRPPAQPFSISAAQRRTPLRSASLRHQIGFTLTELAVVLVIVALLIGSLMIPMSAQQDARYTEEAQQKLQATREALLGYAMINGYLPCPANSATNGIEAARDGSGACPTRVGLLPWATLGVDRLDSWNHQFRYSVTPAFSNSITRFSLSSTRDITIKSRDCSSCAETNLTTDSDIAAAIISHGKNGTWSYNESGTQMPDGSSTNADEDENGNGVGTTFFSRSISSDTTNPGGEFDDLVTWIPSSTLMNRMVAAGKLP